MEEKLQKADKLTVIVTGPESTGKTTIALDLADRFRGMYISEFARDYVLKLNREYNYNDICLIAEEQRKQFLASQIDQSNKVVFIDTYLIITKIWMDWHSHKYEEWLDQEIRQTKDCLYLLCAPDIEWVADEVRENGGKSRNKLFTLYLEEIERYNLDYKIVIGSGNDRIENAIGAVNEYIKAKQDV